MHKRRYIFVLSRVLVKGIFIKWEKCGRPDKTALKKLEKSGEINKQTTNKFTLVTICNYAKYQDSSDGQNTEMQQTNNNQTTNKQQTNNNIQEIKNDNKEKNDKTLSNTVELFNSICTDLPKMKIMSSERKANGVFTFDWVIKKQNAIKVCEGNYDNRKKGRSIIY